MSNSNNIKIIVLLASVFFFKANKNVMRKNNLFTIIYTVPSLTLNCLSLNEPTLKLI